MIFSYRHSSGISFWMSLLLNLRNCVKLRSLDFWSLGKMTVGQFFKGRMWSNVVKCYTREYSSRLTCQVLATVDLLLCCCDSVLSSGKPYCGFGGASRDLHSSAYQRVRSSFPSNSHNQNKLLLFSEDVLGLKGLGFWV